MCRFFQRRAITNHAEQGQQPPPDDYPAYLVLKRFGAYLFIKENWPSLLLTGLISGIGTGASFAIPWLFETVTDLMASPDNDVNTLGCQFNLPELIGLLILAYTVSQVVPNCRNQVVSVIKRNSEKKLRFDCLQRQHKPLGDTEDPLAFTKKAEAVSKLIPSIFAHILPILIETIIASIFLSILYGFPAGSCVLATLAGVLIYSQLSSFPFRHIHQQALDDKKETLSTLREQLLAVDAEPSEPATSLTHLGEIEQKQVERSLQFLLGYPLVTRSIMVGYCMYMGLNVKDGEFSIVAFVIYAIFLNMYSNNLPYLGMSIQDFITNWGDLSSVMQELSHDAEPYRADRGLIREELEEASDPDDANPTWSMA
jgi:hypothetical protein